MRDRNFQKTGKGKKLREISNKREARYITEKDISTSDYFIALFLIYFLEPCALLVDIYIFTCVSSFFTLFLFFATFKINSTENHAEQDIIIKYVFSCSRYFE